MEQCRREWRQRCLPRYLQSSQRGWPWPWPWWGGSISDRPRTDDGTEPSDPLPPGASAPCQTRTRPAVFPSRPEASGQIWWLGKETDRQRTTCKRPTQATSSELLPRRQNINILHMLLRSLALSVSYNATNFLIKSSVFSKMHPKVLRSHELSPPLPPASCFALITLDGPAKLWFSVCGMDGKLYRFHI